MRKVKLTLGDWSRDGHGNSDYFVFMVNKTVSEIRQGYKDSCKKFGFQFHSGKNYTKKEYCWIVCEEVGEDITLLCLEELDKLRSISRNAGAIIDKFNENKNISQEEKLILFSELVMCFIAASITDLIWYEAKFYKSKVRHIEPINGWWNEELNCSFGYGLWSEER